MIIKGGARGNGTQLGKYLLAVRQNEEVRVVEIRGVSATDVPGAVREMEALSLGTRTKKGLYHAQINPRIHERLTDDQRATAVDRLEHELGFAGQPRVVVIHEKHGRQHIHVTWARTDLERMRAIPDNMNYRKHELVARDLERRFGHERVQGVHIERDGKPRPERTPSHAEMLQAERTKLDPQQVKEQITELWRGTQSAEDFAMALWRSGYVLARGDRRDYVAIDPLGGIHSLARRVDGARVKDIRERMAGLDTSRVPNIADAKQIQRIRHEQTAERLKAGREMTEPKVETVRRDEEERSRSQGISGLDWTGKGGMVEQQRSAMDWMEKAFSDKAARTEQGDQRRESSEGEKALQQRRQQFLRMVGREQENELDDGRDFGRERGRSR